MTILYDNLLLAISNKDVQLSKKILDDIHKTFCQYDKIGHDDFSIPENDPLFLLSNKFDFIERTLHAKIGLEVLPYYVNNYVSHKDHVSSIIECIMLSHSYVSSKGMEEIFDAFKINTPHLLFTEHKSDSLFLILKHIPKPHNLIDKYDLFSLLNTNCCAKYLYYLDRERDSNLFTSLLNQNPKNFCLSFVFTLSSLSESFYASNVDKYEYDSFFIEQTFFSLYPTLDFDTRETIKQALDKKYLKQFSDQNLTLRDNDVIEYLLLKINKIDQYLLLKNNLISQDVKKHEKLKI